MVHMKTGVPLKPAALGDAIPAIPPDSDPRLSLADWMANPNNPFFAKALVNRYWKHFFQRGLIEPEDEFGTRIRRRIPNCWRHSKSTSLPVGLI